MSEKSSPGETPCVYRFSAMLTKSQLPVRSPLPKRQPSSRSAPAISASSAAAMPVPRSLCGCTDRMIESRLARLRCIHSIMSAKVFGVQCSTVVGRLMMHLFCGVAPQASTTASTTRLEKSSSVSENVSGEYSKPHSVSGCSATSCLTSFVWPTAISTMPSSSIPSTTLRMTGAQAL